jgi:hypothetical protein
MKSPSSQVIPIISRLQYVYGEANIKSDVNSEILWFELRADNYIKNPPAMHSLSKIPSAMHYLSKTMSALQYLSRLRLLQPCSISVRLRQPCSISVRFRQPCSISVRFLQPCSISVRFIQPCSISEIEISCNCDNKQGRAKRIDTC